MTDKDIIRTGLQKDAEKALERMVVKVNQGFTGGKIGKTDLLSWITIWFSKKEIEKQKETIQADHFDEISHLKSIVSMYEAAKKTGQTPPELETLLTPVIKSSKPKGPGASKTAIKTNQNRSQIDSLEKVWE